MVPIRQYIYPYIFGKAFLQDLDPMPGEDDQPGPVQHSADGSQAAEEVGRLQLDVKDPEIGFEPPDPQGAFRVSFLLDCGCLQI